jgi:glycosyltransferase involved in cell wall biosynthesis
LTRPKFSLIVATVGRSDEFARLLDSLQAQTTDAFELIVADQNNDDRIAGLIARGTWRFNVVHLRLSVRGLARARNAGLRVARGEVIAFPDDDCWYEPDTLESVRALLDAHPETDVLSGRFVDGDGRGEKKWPKRPMRVKRFNLWRCTISISLFLRRAVLTAVPGFDESLGVGAGTRFGAGEESDFLLRCLAAGKRIDYQPSIVLRHPLKDRVYDDTATRQAHAYAVGVGRVLRIHQYPFWFLAGAVAVPALGSFAGIMLGRRDVARLRLGIASGRLSGWFAK